MFEHSEMNIAEFPIMLEKRKFSLCCSWMCFLYGLLIVALGLAIPIASGWDIARNTPITIGYIAFQILIYIISIGIFIFFHFSVGNAKRFVNHVKDTFKKVVQFFQHIFYPKRSFSITNDKHNFEEGIDGDDEASESEEHEKEKVGKHGLTFSVKVSTIIFLIMISVQISIYVQTRLSANSDCHLDEKGALIVLELLFVLFQAHFLLTAQKDQIEKWPLLFHFAFAHLASSTICLGLFLTVHADVLNLYPIYKRAKDFHLHEQNETSLHADEEHLSASSYSAEDVMRRRKRSVPVVLLNVSKPCSLNGYINNVQGQLKPFTFQLSMFYVYSCTIILILLFSHVRKTYTRKISMVFKKVVKGGATFSSSAGLSLIILGVITSLLTMNAENNIYAIGFLLFLHTQACFVGLFALGKIIHVPCTINTSRSNSLVIFSFFYLFIMISVTFKIITRNVNSEHSSLVTAVLLETIEAALDVFQLYLQGVLILIGFCVAVDRRILAKKVMPTHILIHLAATNLSDLIANVFRKDSSEYFPFTSEGHGHEASGHREEEGLSSGRIFSTILGSILIPAISFHRFYSIVCLIKLHKLWSPAEHGIVRRETTFRKDSVTETNI